MAALGEDLGDTTAVQVYTVHDMHSFVAEELARRGAMRHGLTWHFNRPPVVELDYEMDCRSIPVERVSSERRRRVPARSSTRRRPGTIPASALLPAAASGVAFGAARNTSMFRCAVRSANRPVCSCRKCIRKPRDCHSVAMSSVGAMQAAVLPCLRQVATRLSISRPGSPCARTGPECPGRATDRTGRDDRHRHGTDRISSMLKALTRLDFKQRTSFSCMC